MREGRDRLGQAESWFTISIDGPVAAGKSTIGERVAERIGAVYFDTGLLYRALTLLAIEHDIPASDAGRLTQLAREMDLRIERPSIRDGRQNDVIVNGQDVTGRLRSPEVERQVSPVSAHPEVREALLEAQRRIGRSGSVVMVGRDIGTVVLPDAELKIFLDASVEERARRRFEQMREAGRDIAYDQVLEDLRRRDWIDSQRDVAPLRPADDAIVIESDHLTIDQVADAIIAEAERRLGVLGSR